MLAPALIADGQKTALVERSLTIGGCVNVASTPTKTMVASAILAGHCHSNHYFNFYYQFLVKWFVS
jgi:pyruvate/2-oxoglutarate dehydrogenase complex dihydrolipoamide dehydrogenase (E3) component